MSIEGRLVQETALQRSAMWRLSESGCSGLKDSQDSRREARFNARTKVAKVGKTRKWESGEGEKGRGI